MSVITFPSCYYFMWNRIYIIDDAPGAEEAKQKAPHLPVATLKELEACKTESEADALLKKVTKLPL